MSFEPPQNNHTTTKQELLVLWAFEKIIFQIYFMLLIDPFIIYIYLNLNLSYYVKLGASRQCFWPDTSFITFNHEEIFLWILFLMMCMAYFVRNMQSLMFKTHVFCQRCNGLFSSDLKFIVAFMFCLWQNLIIVITRNLIHVKFMSDEHHEPYIYDIMWIDPTVMYYHVCWYSKIILSRELYCWQYSYG